MPARGFGNLSFVPNQLERRTSVGKSAMASQHCTDVLVEAAACPLGGPCQSGVKALGQPERNAAARIITRLHRRRLVTTLFSNTIRRGLNSIQSQKIRLVKRVRIFSHVRQFAHAGLKNCFAVQLTALHFNAVISRVSHFSSRNLFSASLCMIRT